MTLSVEIYNLYCIYQFYYVTVMNGPFAFSFKFRIYYNDDRIFPCDNIAWKSSFGAWTSFPEIFLCCCFTRNAHKSLANSNLALPLSPPFYSYLILLSLLSRYIGQSHSLISLISLIKRIIVCASNEKVEFSKIVYHKWISIRIVKM